MNLLETDWAHYGAQTAADPSYGRGASAYGRVALVHRDHFIVWTTHGEVTATISGHLRHMDSDPPCVGDWVVLRDASVISQILPRRTERHAPGVPVLAVSALTEWGLDAIARHVEPGETAALLGSSGAGKSTIV